MRAAKAVPVPYGPSEEVLGLLKAFRNVVNYCLQVGLEKGITSRFRLSKEVYHNLRGYGLHTWYYLSAIEVACAILKNYRKAVKKNKRIDRPYAKRLAAKLGNQAYKVVWDRLRIPIKPKEYFFVLLHKRARQFLSDPTLRLGSITLTPDKVVLAFTKTVEVKEPKGYLAFDTNEKSMDGVSSDGEVMRYDLSRIYELNASLFYRVTRLQRGRNKDRRVTQKALSKWFENRNARVDAILHRVSREIIKKAKMKGFGIILEDLRGFKKAANRRRWAVNRHNGKAQLISIHSNRLKRRLNRACTRKLQHFIKYKASWEGMKVVELPPKETSSLCAICGSRLEYMNVHEAGCPKCGVLDRQLNAALNLLKTQDESLRFGLDSWANVAVKRNAGYAYVKANPPSKSPEVKLAAPTIEG